jgi:hypothetical protein
MENQHKFTAKRFGFAFLAFLIVNFVAAIFILPWSIWISATVRLGKLFEEGGILINLRKSEAVVINWFKYFFDGLIFISYIVGLIFSFYALIEYGFEGFIGGIVIFYMVPLGISLVKEFLLVLPFGKYVKLEEIADNTKR